MKKLAVATVVSTLSMLAACSGGSEEPVTPENTAALASAPAQTSTVAPAASSATPSVAAPPSATGSIVVDAPKRVEPGPDLKIVAMKIAIPGTPNYIEVKQDGTVWASNKGKSTQVGKVDKNTIVSNDGAMSLNVLKDNSITATGETINISFDDKDNVIVAGKGKISIDDKGKVDLTKDDGTKEASPPLLTGFKPDGRRLAGLLVIATMLMKEHGSTSVPVSVGPATTGQSTTPATPLPPAKH
jgi:hypothetical protein